MVDFGKDDFAAFLFFLGALYFVEVGEALIEHFV